MKFPLPNRELTSGTESAEEPQKWVNPMQGFDRFTRALQIPAKVPADKSAHVLVLEAE